MAKITLKEALKIVREWYPNRHINIKCEVDYFDHSGEERIQYGIYVSGEGHKYNHSLDTCLEMVRPNTLSIDDQFDILEEVLS